MATRIAWKSIYSVKTTKAGLTYTATKYNILLGLFICYGSILVCIRTEIVLWVEFRTLLFERQNKAFC